MNETRQAPGPSDLAEIYYAPTAVFERRRNGGFWLPLIVLFVASVVLFYATRNLMQPVFDAEWVRGAAKLREQNPQLTPEQLEQAKSMSQNFAVVGLFVAMFLGPLLAGLVLWVVCKFAGVKETLTAAMTVMVFSLFPILVEQVVNAVQAAVLPEDSITSRYSLSLGPARFLEGAAMSTRALVGHIDVFTLWTAVLIAIGVRVTGGATRNQAIAVAAAMWVIGALPTFLTAR
ncbi:MAG TPA: YIP1 family protein [Gemmatimonadales bacterium]